MIAERVGAEMRRALGVAVFAGMLGVTLFGIFLTPVFYDVLQRFGEKPAVTSALATTTGQHGASVDGPWQTSIKQVEVALQTLRQTPLDDEARRRAAEAFEKALQKLQELPRSGDGKNG